MDPHYLRLRRKRRLVRAAAVCAFFAVLSLPLLYLLRHDIAAGASAIYREAQRGQATASATQVPPVPPQAAPEPAAAAPAPAPAPAPTPSPAKVVTTQAQAAKQPAPKGRQQTAKLGDATFRIPEGYLEGKADLGSKRDPYILLRALLPDLRPRNTGKGNCAPKQINCPDFVTIRLRPAKDSLESEFRKRYKTAPSEITLISGLHGLRQIPPHKAQPGGRQYLAQPGGRWVWITCRDFGRPSPKRPTPGVCQLDFDGPDGLAVKVRFDKSKLAEWSSIHAKAVALINDFRN
jgi:hypothetical protein